MSGDITASVSGGDEIADMLRDLGAAEKGAFKREARRSIRQAMQPLKADAQANAPVKTGRLKKAIKLQAWKRPANGEIGVKLVVNRGQSRDDPNGAYYGMMVENGHIVGGKYVPGKYMLSNAHARHGEAAGAAVAAAIVAVADGIAK